MSWRLVWAETAEEALRRMPWRDAARVDAALIQLAATGRGHLRRLPSDDAVTIRLTVPPYFARLIVDRRDKVFFVVAIYRLER